MAIQRNRRSFLISAGLGAASRLHAEPPAKLRALIVDGFSNHDWRKTTSFLSRLLAHSGRFHVAVSTSPGAADARGWDAWRPRFRDYDLLVLNMNNIQQPEVRWPRPVEEALETYAHGGGGVLAFHSANNAFPHWGEYNRMIGIGWRKKEQGWALSLDPAGAITRIPPGEGAGTSHGPRQDTVVVRLGEHPITRGMPQRWLTPDIEVYENARGPAENLTVLSYGQHRGSGRFWPLEWVVHYGRGRVYSSSFGHIWSTDTGISDRVRCAGFQTSFLRAAEWAATGAVTLPVPADFPTEDRISLRNEA